MPGSQPEGPLANGDTEDTRVVIERMDWMVMRLPLTGIGLEW